MLQYTGVDSMIIPDFVSRKWKFYLGSSPEGDVDSNRGPHLRRLRLGRSFRPWTLFFRKRGLSSSLLESVRALSRKSIREIPEASEQLKAFHIR